jgi:AbrB family looped-hinge helix DNA binding protein
MSVGTLTSKGQTTIPKEIRDALGLKAGDELVFRAESGRILIYPRTGSIRDLRGLLERPNRPAASVEEMNAAIGEAIAESVMPKTPRVK